MATPVIEPIGPIGSQLSVQQGRDACLRGALPSLPSLNFQKFQLDLQKRPERAIVGCRRCKNLHPLGRGDMPMRPLTTGALVR